MATVDSSQTLTAESTLAASAQSELDLTGSTQSELDLTGSDEAQVSKLFHQYRTLGCCSNHIPLQIFHSEARQETYIVTCIGQAWHIYNCSKLGITRVSDVHPDDITALAVDEYYVMSACGPTIYVRGHRSNAKREFIGHINPVHLLLPFGHHVVSVDTGGEMIVWERDACKEHVRVSLRASSSTTGPGGFDASTVCHPPTYRDKVLLGSHEGPLQLWNIKDGRLLYSFSGWGSGVSALRPAPALHTVAIGLNNGAIMIHNIKFDEVVFSLRQDWGEVASLAFRTDGPPILLSAGSGGQLAVWDLEKRRLVSQQEEAHSACAVSGMECPPSEPLVITSGADNSVKVWIFDQPDGGVRLLHSRTGHSAPPTRVRFCSDTDIISAAQDASLCSFSTIRDNFNKHLGRASAADSKNRKVRKAAGRMPAIRSFDLSTRRVSDWSSILACHERSNTVTLWDYRHATLPKRIKFSSQRGVATCVAVTACGNFGLVGFTSGVVELVNMQSQLSRGVFGQEGSGHQGEVRGIAIGDVNQSVVTGGADGELKWWTFRTKKVLDSLKTGSSVHSMELHRANDLLAVALDDFSVIVVDMDTHRVTRTLKAHTSTLTALAFSPDGRWLVTGAMDTTLVTWDLPSGQPVDRLTLNAPPNSATFSPAGDLLAVTMVSDLGVTLLCNRAMYTHVDLLALGSTAQEDLGKVKDASQLAADLVTLAGLPTSRWANLLRLDVIRQRNKPRAPPSKPKLAPFFIPTTPGLTPTFDLSNMTTNEKAEKVIIPMATDEDFLTLLSAADSADGAEKVISFLKELGPSAIDSTVRSLSPHFGGSVDQLLLLLTALLRATESCKHYEAVQGYLSLTLKVHGKDLVKHSSLLDVLVELEEAQHRQWARLEETSSSCLSVIQYLKKATL